MEMYGMGSQTRQVSDTFDFETPASPYQTPMTERQIKPGLEGGECGRDEQPSCQYPPVSRQMGQPPDDGARSGVNAANDALTPKSRTTGLGPPCKPTKKCRCRMAGHGPQRTLQSTNPSASCQQCQLQPQRPEDKGAKCSCNLHWRLLDHPAGSN